MTSYRSFGRTQHTGQRYVCDTLDAIKEGGVIMAPEPDGTKRRRIIEKLGAPFRRGSKVMVYGYLTDGFCSLRQLHDRGWTETHIRLLGPAEDTRRSPLGELIPLWSAEKVSRVQHSKAFAATGALLQLH